MSELPPFKNPPPNSETAPIGDNLPSQVKFPAERSDTGRWQGVRSLFAWILRWMLLGVGVGGVWVLGILVAQFFPASNPDPPLQEVVARRTQRFVQKVRRLPAWWAGDSPRSVSTTAVPRLRAEPTTPIPSSRPITLSDAQREQVSVELEAIQSEVQRLRDRTSALEQRLGLPNLELSLQERLESVENRLSPPTDPPETAATAPSDESSTSDDLSATEPEASPDPLFQVDAYRVTLPGDVLFNPGEATLQVNSQPLLDNILLDVGRYPGATVLVGSYTDVQVGEGTVTDLSYKQAIAVQQYLSQRLADDYHWVAVGYGNTAVGTIGSSQLSRRVTIAIVP